MDSKWKAEMAEKLEQMLVGRPYVLIVYDEPTTKAPREPWMMNNGVPYWSRSTVSREDIEKVIDHLRWSLQQSKDAG